MSSIINSKNAQLEFKVKETSYQHSQREKMNLIVSSNNQKIPSKSPIIQHTRRETLPSASYHQTPTIDRGDILNNPSSHNRTVPQLQTIQNPGIKTQRHAQDTRDGEFMNHSPGYKNYPGQSNIRDEHIQAKQAVQRTYRNQYVNDTFDPSKSANSFDQNIKIEHISNNEVEQRSSLRYSHTNRVPGLKNNAHYSNTTTEGQVSNYQERQRSYRDRSESNSKRDLYYTKEDDRKDKRRDKTEHRQERSNRPCKNDLEQLKEEIRSLRLEKMRREDEFNKTNREMLDIKTSLKSNQEFLLSLKADMVNKNKNKSHRSINKSRRSSGGSMEGSLSRSIGRESHRNYRNV